MDITVISPPGIEREIQQVVETTAKEHAHPSGCNFMPICVVHLGMKLSIAGDIRGSVFAHFYANAHLKGERWLVTSLNCLN